MTLTTQPPHPLLDLAPQVGQRSATYRFDIVDINTGYRVRVYPVADSPPTLSHNVRSTVKRSLTGLQLTADDTVKFNSITSRLEVFMLLRAEVFPLGRYVPASWVRRRTTAGVPSSTSFYDEGVIVDQQLDTSFGPTAPLATESVPLMLDRLLRPLPITYTYEPSPYDSSGSWGIGARRGSVVETLALDGDYFSPWFDNSGTMRFIRTFDPATAIPTFDLDEGNRVIRDQVLESDDLTEVPNRFIIIGNGSSSVGTDTEVVGVADVPASAPHSIANRGFIIPYTETRQVTDAEQAASIARNLALRVTAIEQVDLATPPDPRHDSYDVLRWRGVNWLETSWSLQLIEGATMQHAAQRAYTP